MIQNTFIYLIGLPGTGKLTIAGEIKKLLPAILVDNHLINNVVFCLIDPDGKTKLPAKVWEHTLAIRQIVLETIRTLSKPNRNFIFTNALTNEDPADAVLFQEIVDLAKAKGARLFTVRLLISTEQLVRRVVSPDRVAKLKGIDPDAARRQSETHTVFTPKTSDYIDLDVSNLTAAEAAQHIIRHLGSE